MGEFGLNISFWLNIDKLTLKCVLHVDGCRHVENARYGSKWKDFESIGKWGGWLKFNTREEALDYYNQHLRSIYELKLGCSCLQRRELKLRSDDIKVIMNDKSKEIIIKDDYKNTDKKNESTDVSEGEIEYCILDKKTRKLNDFIHQK